MNIKYSLEFGGGKGELTAGKVPEMALCSLNVSLDAVDIFSCS